MTLLFMVKYKKITLFDEFLVLLGPITSRLFTCSNEEKRMLALLLSLCFKHEDLQFWTRFCFVKIFCWFTFAEMDFQPLVIHTFKGATTISIMTLSITTHSLKSWAKSVAFYCNSECRCSEYHSAGGCHAEGPYAECPYAECPYAKCPYAECPYVKCPYAGCHYVESDHAECRYSECPYVEYPYAGCHYV
jgi:hypothetical protein